MSDSNGHRVLTWEEIVAADDRKTEYVAVPEWGGGVMLRGISVDEALASGEGAKDSIEAGIRLLVRCIVDPVVPEEGIAVLRSKSMGAFNRLMDAANRLCGIEDKAVDKAVARFQAGPDAEVPVSPGA